MTPTVSVVIPCYNAQRHVGEAIESALAQSYSPVEVIIVNDGSTDGSLDVIRSFGARIRWESGPNRGVSAARNRGLALARGDLIQFLDADDLLHPEKFARMVPIAVASATGLVFCDGVKVDPESGSRLVPLTSPLKSQDPVVCLAREGVPTPAPLHKTWQLRAVGGFLEDLRYSEDTDLHMRLACCGVTFTHVPEVLYFVRQLPTGLCSSTARVKKADNVSGIVRRAEELLRARESLTEARAEALAGYLLDRARVYLRSGHLRKAYQYDRQARRLHRSRGVRLAYPGRARAIAPIFGLFLTELLTVMDDAWRGLARRFDRSPARSKIGVDCDT